MPGALAIWKIMAAIPATCAERQVTLPKDAFMRIIATPVGSNVIEVEWEKKRFLVSRVDLANNGERVAGNRASRNR